MTPEQLVCIPVSICWTGQPSVVYLSSTEEHLHWSEPNVISNVDLRYNHNTDGHHLCFHSVNESFYLLEYCLVHKECEATCCKHWSEFVSRACVKVAGDEGELNC